jgi:hypothetical protein
VACDDSSRDCVAVNVPRDWRTRQGASFARQMPSADERCSFSTGVGNSALSDLAAKVILSKTTFRRCLVERQ